MHNDHLPQPFTDKDIDQHLVVINSLGASIEVISSLDNIDEIVERNHLAKSIIPEFQAASKAIKKPNWSIYHTQSRNKSIKVHQNKIFISDDWSTAFPNYMFFFMYQLLDRSFQRRNKISLHSSAVELKGNGYVFCGTTGVGKTGCALTAIFTHYCKLLSTNRTILGIEQDTPFIEGGSRMSSIREHDMHRYADIKTLSTLSVHQGRHYLELNDELSIAGPVPLKGIYNIIVSPGHEEYQKLPTDFAACILNNNSSLSSWGECILFDGKIVTPVRDTTKLAQRRLDLLSKIAEKIPVYNIKGSVDFIMQKAFSMT